MHNSAQFSRSNNTSSTTTCVYHDNIRTYCLSFTFSCNLAAYKSLLITNSISMIKDRHCCPFFSQTVFQLRYQFNFSYCITCTNWDLLTSCTHQVVDEDFLQSHFFHRSCTSPKSFLVRPSNIDKCYYMTRSFGSLGRRWNRRQIAKTTAETADIVSWLAAWGKSCFINKRDSWC